jgi:voltage-gated potassium channel
MMSPRTTSSPPATKIDLDARGANITTLGDALWWAMSTVTTVGYGDRYPVSGQGRFIAAGLMLAGIALLGIVTASLASWLIDKVRAVEETAQAATRADVAAPTAEIRAFRQELVLHEGEEIPAVQV